MSPDEFAVLPDERNSGETIPSNPATTRVTMFAALLVLCAVIAYLPAVNAGFIWDDDVLLTANPLMQSTVGLKAIWLGKHSCDYTPLTLTTFWLEKRLWGETAIGYHVVNILLHAFAAVLLWRVLSLLQLPGSWLAALLFVVHPVNVASVAWIAELKNTLSAVLFFASILAFLAAGKHGSAKLYLSSIALFALAGLSKGAVVTMPVVLCGCILWRNKKITLGDLARVTPFALVALAVACLTIHYQSSAPDYGLVPSNLPFRLARAGTVVWLYLAELLFPVRLSPMLPQWQPDLSSPVVYFPTFVIAATLGVFFCNRKSWGRPFLFVSGCYLWLLLPVLGFVWMALQQETPSADWWQYLAAPAIFAGAAAGFVTISGSVSRAGRLRLSALICLVLALLTVQTWRRSAIYQSMETYCYAVLAENRHAWTLQTYLGVVFEQRGQFEEAIACHRQALRDNPRLMEAHNNLANVLSAMGNWREAESEFLAALKLSPSNAVILGNLADNYFRQSKIREALAADADAIKADRYNARRYIEFGLKLAANKQFEQAAVCFKNATILNPTDIVSQVSLVQAMVAAGHRQDAFAVCDRAMQTARESGNKQLIQKVALLSNQLGRPTQQ